MQKTFTISGSHGQVEVDAETGKVIRKLVWCDGTIDGSRGGNCEEHDCDYAAFTYDVNEWRQKFPGLTLEGNDLDILDIGYTYSDGLYEAPAQDWRDERALRCIEDEPEGEGLTEGSPQELIDAAYIARMKRIEPEFLAAIQRDRQEAA